MSLLDTAPGFVAVDWGTTSLRAARIDAQGHVLSERSSAQGILAVPAGGFATVLEASLADWDCPEGTIIVMSGMVGSRQGWHEAPYCACPAGFDDIATRLAWVPDAPGGMHVAIVPGMTCTHGGVPDVMRGEEVQVFGALRQLGWPGATVVLPGTHSKWVTVRGNRIEGFATYMTGEFYALLRQHSILARTLPADTGGPGDALEPAAFDRGVAQALAGPSLLATAFSTRTLALFEQMAPAAQPSYLSGLVIGEELRARAPPRGGSVVLVGAPALTARYARALAQCGVGCELAGAQSTWLGLWAIAQQIREIP